MIRIELVGQRELLRVLQQMPQKAQRALVQRAARPALNRIKADAASRVRSIAVASGAAAQTRDQSGRFVSKATLAEAGGPGTRDSIARSLKVSTRRPKKGVVGARLAVRYPRRSGNRIGSNQRAALAHLLEWGFEHRGGKRIKGHEFMTQAFAANKAEAEAMFRRALQSLINDPSLKAKAVAKIARAG